MYLHTSDSLICVSADLLSPLKDSLLALEEGHAEELLPYDRIVQIWETFTDVSASKVSAPTVGAASKS